MENKFTIPSNIEEEAKHYMEEVLQMLETNGVLENVDTAALNMLAINYSTFIRASKQLEEEGLTVRSDRGNLQAHPAIKIARDALIQAMKVMCEFGLTAKARTKLPKLDSNLDNNPLVDFIKLKKQDGLREYR